MKLRHAAASPFARKVMVAANELGLVDRIELMPTSVSPVQANDGLAAESLLMKVPSLVTDDGQTLLDSPVICEYLNDLAGGCKLFPPPELERLDRRSDAQSAPGARCGRTRGPLQPAHDRTHYDRVHAGLSRLPLP